MSMANQIEQIYQEPNLVGRWVRERGFGPSPIATASGWWLAPVSHDGRFEAYSYRHNMSFIVSVTGTGHEIIDVLEINDGLAKFRHYIVNPAGVRLSLLSVPKFETVNQVRDITLRKKLKRLRMQREEARKTAVTAAVTVSHSANIIAFPASRIVRRAESAA
jgi:hypothetical protein